MKKSGKETPIKTVDGGQSQYNGFVKLCEERNITPTKRQFSKFRNKKGRLYNAIYKSEA